MLANNSFSNTKFRNDIITYFENADMHMEEINNFLTELELGSHILNGRLLALRSNTRISEIKMEPSGNDSLQTESKLAKKLTATSSSHIQRALSDMSSSSISYLRCGRIHSTLPLPKSSSNLASDDSSISIISNSHRRRAFSLGSQLSTNDVYQDMHKIPQPTHCIRSVTYPTYTTTNSSTSSSCPTNTNRRQAVRLRSSSLSTFEKSQSNTSCSGSISTSSNNNVVRKPSKSMLSHQLLLRETVRAALSESFPDKCFDSSDPSLQQFTFLTVQDVMMKVVYLLVYVCMYVCMYSRCSTLLIILAPRIRYYSLLRTYILNSFII